jgi:hypothetical protein
MYDLLRSFLAFVPHCDNEFQGGGWLLVRRVKQGATWHPAVDNLQGTDVYGTDAYRASNVDDLTFSLEFASMISSETLFLITSGKRCNPDLSASNELFSLLLLHLSHVRLTFLLSDRPNPMRRLLLQGDVGTGSSHLTRPSATEVSSTTTNRDLC